MMIEGMEAMTAFWWIPAILMAVGGAVQSYGMIQQGKARREQAEYNAEVNRSNALQKKLDAQFKERTEQINKQESLMDAALRSSLIRDRGEQKRAKMQSRMAAAGLDPGSSSGLDLIKAQVLQEEFNSNMALFDAYRKGVGHNVESRKARQFGDRALLMGQSRAEALRAAGRNAETSSYFSAAGNMFSVLGNAAGTYMGMKPN